MDRQVEHVDGRRHVPGVVGASVYLLCSIVPGIFWLVFLAAVLSVGSALTIVWVGLPILAAGMVVWRAGAQLERRWVHATLGYYIATPYRPRPKGLLRGLRGMVADPATWRDLVYLLLLFPLGVAEFVLFAVLWGVGLLLVSLPVWYRFLPENDRTVVNMLGGDIRYEVHSFADALPPAAFGVLALCLALVLARLLGRAHGKLAVALLRPSRATVLAAERELLKAGKDELRASRARGVDAAEAERRRIERDLHDGAQQRLVAVAMGLGRVRTKLDRDPEGARQLIEEAHADAKRAIAELRDLARGIYPAVLGDRGLDAALSALTAKASVPVQVHVDPELSGDRRPPAALESVAYFTVAEALTNITKHAGATRVSVEVRRERDHVIVEITDDGRGGAAPRPGGGLAGLADRAATIDGVLTVLSPAGGPTVLRADLPCEW